MTAANEVYTAGTFGDSPEPEETDELALVCVSCGTEVCLITVGGLAEMETLPDHNCKARRAA